MVQGCHFPKTFVAQCEQIINKKFRLSSNRQNKNNCWLHGTATDLHCNNTFPYIERRRNDWYHAFIGNLTLYYENYAYRWSRMCGPVKGKYLMICHHKLTNGLIKPIRCPQYDTLLIGKVLQPTHSVKCVGLGLWMLSRPDVIKNYACMVSNH